MKNILIILFLVFSFKSFADEFYTNEIQGLDGCQLLNKIDGQKYYECSFKKGAKKISLLDLSGTIESTAYYHGLFLGEKIKEGLIKGVMTRKNNALAELSESDRNQYNVVSGCLINRYKRSISKEFLKMTKNMSKGISDGGVSGVSEKELLEANLLVEMSIYFDGIELLSEENKILAYSRIFSNCGLPILGNKVLHFFKRVTHLFKGVKHGCTGISASSHDTKDGVLLLSRNFDTGLLGYFEKFPVIILNHSSRGNSYVGMAGAGLHYVGGVSGMNDKGLAISLHELQTTKFRTEYIFRNSDISPFVSNEILEKTGSIDEAYKLVRKNRGFGAWTFFIGDSKTDEIASIELSGKKVKLARRTRHEPMIQTNHFHDPKIVKYGFQYSFNKTLETNSRFNYMNEEVRRDKGLIDTQWIIDHLAGHTDFYTGMRSFGRTVTKVYTSMSHVMIPEKKEFWFALSDVLPATSSDYYGLRINFEKSDEPFFTFVGTTYAKNKELENHPSWKKSLESFVSSFLAYDWGNHSLESVSAAILHAEEAVRLANEDSIIEVPYHYILARLQILKSSLVVGEERIDLLHQAIFNLELLMNAKVSEGVNLHDYQKSLIYLWLARSYNLISLENKEQVIPHELYSLTHGIHQELLKEYDNHWYLERLVKEYYSKGDYQIFTFEDVRESHIEYVTVE